MSPENGLFPYYMKNAKEEKKTRTRKAARAQSKPHFTNDHLTFGAMADSFYEYMLKVGSLAVSSHCMP
jgi:hypothetical protein